MPPRAEFAAQLIAALEDAQRAAAEGKPAAQLAQAAWDKLQFDFPVVSQEELAALADEYASRRRQDVSARLLGVLRENAGAAAASTAATTVPAPAAAEASTAAVTEGGGAGGADSLVSGYQRLYAVAVLGSLQACLEAPEGEALAALAPLRGAPGSAPFFAAEGISQLEEALAAAAVAAGSSGGTAELEHRLSAQEDDDAFEYEPLDAAAPPAQPLAAATPAAVGIGSAGGSGALAEQLAELAGHLSYHCMSDAGAWCELQGMRRLAACLAAARRHPRFPELRGAMQPLLRLAADRLVAAPAELDAGLPALLDALGIPPSGGTDGDAAGASRQEAAAAAAAAELALEAAVALMAQVSSPSARRGLWQAVHQRLLPVAARQLEAAQVQLARQARAAGGSAATAAATAGGQPTTEQLYCAMLPCQLVYCYVLQAPPAMAAAAPPSGASRLQEALLRGGLLRSLALLFVQLGGQPGAEPLRCAVLLACASAQVLADWAAAVPGFTAATAAPQLQPGGEAALHGTLWRLLLSGDGAALAALLADAAPADKVPAIFQALQLMADVQAVARRPLWAEGGEVDAALRALAGTLRQLYGRPRQEDEGAAGSDAAGESGGQASALDAAAAEGSGAREELELEVELEDEKKLATSQEDAAAALAARRAAQLQPACLKLVKDLLQRRAGAGKHD